jgi:hypothetical protein
MMGAHRLGWPVVPVPLACKRALKLVQWPAWVTDAISDDDFWST